ncbi:MAG: hypothetical protein ACPHID_06450 [Thermoplasmatota archaeon]
MRPILVLSILLLLSGAAAAQPGPAPGYASAIDYAADYGQQQASAATTDPESYAANKTAPGAADEEVRHTAYVACWAADDVGIQSEVCDDYYTPRGQENAQQECDCNATPTAQAFVNETAHNATALAGNATQFVNETVEDPKNVTSHAQSFVAAVSAFATATVASAQQFVDDIIQSALACAGLASFQVGAATEGTQTLGQLIGDVATLAAATLDDAATQSGDFVTQGLKAIGTGLATAAEATGDALATAGHAIADAATAVKDAVLGIFDDNPQSEATKPVDDIVKDVDTDGLLDPVSELLS